MLAPELPRLDDGEPVRAYERLRHERIVDVMPGRGPTDPVARRTALALAADRVVRDHEPPIAAGADVGGRGEE